jgi:hypothetical protein
MKKTDNMMMLTMIWKYALLLALLLQQTAAQCPGTVLTTYMECVAQNPCECSFCDPDPTDDVPVITAQEPNNCLDVARVFCPLIRCCSICEAAALEWNQCSADGFANAFLGRECPLEDSCGAYPLQDVDCAPTMSPSELDSSSPTESNFPTGFPTAPPSSETAVAAVPLEVSESPTAAPVLPRAGISEPTLAPSLSSDMVPTLAPSLSLDMEPTPSGARPSLGFLRLSGILIVATLGAAFW